MARHSGSVAGRCVIALVLAAMPSGAPGLGAETDLVLTHPQATWSLRLSLPGYSVSAGRLFRDHSQVWVEARDPASGMLLTGFIEKVDDARNSAGCRKYYLKKLKGRSPKPALSERGEMAITGVLVAEKAGAALPHKDLHAYLFRDGFCADLHVSKPEFETGQEALFDAVLETVALVPATEADLAAARGYEVSGGPGEHLFRDAARLLRAKDFAAADALLSPGCPLESGRLFREARQGSPACMLRVAALTEAGHRDTPEKLGLLYWSAGEALEKQGMPGAAEEAFRKSLDLDPKDSMTWYSLGHVYRHLKDLDAADGAFRKAHELDPGDATTMYWIATNLADQGRLAEAESMLDQVLEKDPKEVRVWYRRGQIKMQQGEYDAAIALFEKARSLGVDAGMVKQRIEECRQALASSVHAQGE